MKENDPKFKYYQQIKNLNLSESCPPENVQNRTIGAYRFTKETLNANDTFLPQGIKNPVRINHISDRKVICNLIAGLSFFITKEAATKKFNRFTKQIKRKLAYTHIAFGNLSVEDGAVSPINKEGHFTLFEYEYVDLISKFDIIDKLD